jgi:hypothetical protein
VSGGAWWGGSAVVAPPPVATAAVIQYLTFNSEYGMMFIRLSETNQWIENRLPRYPIWIAQSNMADLPRYQTNKKENIMADEKEAVKKKLSWRRDGNTITCTFPDGHVQLFDCDGIVDFLVLTSDVQRELMFYGIKQFLADKTAGLKDATTADRVNIMVSRFAGLKAGEFKVNAKGDFLRIDKKGVNEKLDAMPEKEQEKYRKVLEKLGIKL